MNIEETWCSKNKKWTTVIIEKIISGPLVEDLEHLSEADYALKVETKEYSEIGNIILGTMKIGNVMAGKVKFSEKKFTENFEKQ